MDHRATPAGVVLVAALATLEAGAAAGSRPAVARRELSAWGFETLERIRADLFIAERGLYAEECDSAKGRGGPAFAWGAGVMLSALNAAAAADRRHVPELKSYVEALDVYWNAAGPTPGYDVLPCPKPVDRYYDDNAWLVLAMIEARDVLRDDACLDRAERAMTYVLSGLDEKLGGGIYWRESDRASKNTCSNAPSALACYRLYAATRKRRYRELGDRILDWTISTLRDPADRLMWDNVSLAGEVQKTKWSYNTALTIRAILARADLEKNLVRARELRDDAAAMAEAGLARWQDPGTGAFRDDAAFAHLFAEALLELDRELGREHFRPAVIRALSFLHGRVRDPNGRYPKRWETPQAEPLGKARLLEQASAARAYLLAAPAPLRRRG